MRSTIASAILFLLLLSLNACSKSRVEVVSYDDTPTELRWGGAFVSSVPVSGSLKTQSYARLEFAEAKHFRLVVDDAGFNILWVVEGRVASVAGTKAELQCDSIDVYPRADGIRDENRRVYRWFRGAESYLTHSSVVVNQIQDFKTHSTVLNGSVPLALRECQNEKIMVYRELGADSLIHLKSNQSEISKGMDYVQVPLKSIPPL